MQFFIHWAQGFAIPTNVSFQIREDWKYVAMVVDRAQLWLFFLVTTIGTVGILMDAPHIFEFVDQDRIIDIYRGKWKRDNRCQSSTRRVNLEKFLTVTMDFLGLQYDPRHSDRVFGNLWAADFWKNLGIWSLFKKPTRHCGCCAASHSSQWNEGPDCVNINLESLVDTRALLLCT